MSAISEGYRIGGEVRLPDWLMKMDLSSGEKLTFNVLATCSGGRDHAWPGQKYLAERVSVSIRSIQRYLSELAKRGLIAISRERIKGKWRCVYTFLRPGQECGSEEGGDKLSPQAVKQENPKAECPSYCHLNSDKMSPSLNKEESIKGKEYTPPTPTTSEPMAEQTLIAGSVGGESVETENEKKAPEDPIWSQVKERLWAELGESVVRGWMEPLKFERKEHTVILQAPNPFFLKWLKEHYADGLRNSFQAIGYEVRLEVEEITPEEKLLRQQPPASTPSAAAAIRPPQEEPNWGAMTLEEQYKKIYEAYPRVGKFWRGLQVFRKLIKQEDTPAPGKLVQAIAKQAETDSWQRENRRYVPNIAKWLLERGWLDLGFTE